jgi:uncharacterized protein
MISSFTQQEVLQDSHRCKKEPVSSDLQLMSRCCACICFVLALLHASESFIQHGGIAPSARLTTHHHVSLKPQLHRAVGSSLFNQECSKAPCTLHLSSSNYEDVILKNTSSAAAPTIGIINAVLAQSLLIPLALGLGKLLSLDLLTPIVWSREAFAYGLAGAVPIGLVGVLLDLPKWDWTTEISSKSKQFIISLLGADGGGRSGIVFAIGISLAAGFGEELLFRAVLQGSLQTVTGVPIAVATSAAVFGALHAVTPMYAVIAGMIGVYFSYLWTSTGNLAVPIIAHAVYDAGAILFMCRRLSIEAATVAAAAAAESSDQSNDSKV